MSRAPIIGIDLGTTYSLAAVVQSGRPVLVPNAIGEHLTPSAVSVEDDGTVLVGAPARARAASAPERTALAFKRDMGTERTYVLGGRRFTPVELSALVLRSVKDDAERMLGMTVEEAVISVPAYFGDAQRQATRDAGMIAGLKVERLVNEPTAAALAYGLHNLHRELRGVVLDLGGGTFDVTVLEIIEGVIEIQSSAGDARLGGEDFTDALAAWAGDRLSLAGTAVTLGDRADSRARLREAAELAKRRLTEREQTNVALPQLADSRGLAHDVELAVERGEVERIWEPLLERMRAPIRRALSDANLSPADAAEVLLVGGATRMPCIVRLSAEIFGRTPRTDLPADEAVALGAAIQAALKQGDQQIGDVVVTDVAPFTMGIATGAMAGAAIVEGIYSPILDRGTVIPASRVQRFVTMGPNQRKLTVEVYQGEHSLCRDNTKLGEYTVSGLPRGEAGEVGVDVRFTYDLNGILEVEMRVVGTDRVDHLVIEDRPGKMTKAAIEKARDAMKRIKFHPRESLPNRTAIARADALHVELTGAERAYLGQAIAAFRTALETQDPKLIDPIREELNALIASYRR